MLTTDLMTSFASFDTTAQNNKFQSMQDDIIGRVNLLEDICLQVEDENKANSHFLIQPSPSKNRIV